MRYFDSIRRIREILKDLIPLDDDRLDESKFEGISTGNYDPPAYVIKEILFKVIRLINYGGLEKIYWHTFFGYKGNIFMINDFKFGSWSIRCTKGVNNASKYADEMKSKLLKAAKCYDDLIKIRLRQQIEQENFFIHNTYNKLFPIFRFFRSRTSTSINRYKKVISSSQKASLAQGLKLIKKIVDSEKLVSYYSFALIISFFSLLEFILDSFFAFQRKNIQFKEYKTKKLKDRFKAVFDIHDDKMMRIYNGLFGLMANLRNPLAHGLSPNLCHEVNILVPFGEFGLVPASYEYLSRKVYYGHLPISYEEAQQIIAIFDDFLCFINSIEPFNYYILYIKYGFSIPVDQREINRLKLKMTSYSSFKDFLTRRSEYEDQIINRDI